MTKKKTRENDDNFQLLFDSLGDFVFLLDLEGHIIKANSIVFKRLGYSETELLNRHVQVVLPEEINVGETNTAVTEIITAKDGTFIPVETRTTRGRWNGKDVVYSFSRDISRLIEAEERFDGVFRTHAIPMTISTIDDGRLIEVNEAALETLGYTRDEIIGKTFKEFGIYKNIKQREELLKILEEKGSVTDLQVDVHTKKRGVRSLLVTVNIIRVFGQRVLLSVLNDITGHKAVEDLVLTTRARLEAADKAKREFLANISHELRTPLNGVIGMTAILLDMELTPQQRDFAETISNSADTLLRILNDILDYSKLETGKFSLQVLDFDLRTALEETVETLAPQAQQKGLDFKLVIEPAVPSLLRGDPGRLRQVILNLAGNAVKFTSRGEVTVRVALEREQKQNVILHFSVTDTGIGISPKKLEVLFKAFSQGDASSTRKYSGTGLGLAIAQQLVQKMGGVISVKSEEGKGSVFQFSIRFQKQPAAVLEEPVASDEKDIDLTGLPVLVVVEDNVCRRLLSIMLSSWKCRLQTTNGAQSALNLLRTAARKNDPFRVVLLDMNLPDMSGETLGAAIKKDSRIKDTLLIMMAGMGRRGDVARLEKIGFSGYLIKPIKQSLLHDCLTSVCRGPRQTGAAPGSRIVTRHSIAEDKRRKVRILVAEESATNRKLVLSILGKLGYRADIACDGLEVLKALETTHYDLVLMDCRMPRMDGFEATREIRKREAKHARRLPIIAMTGSTGERARKNCTDAGMDDYIAKPVTPDTVARMLEKWLAGPEPGHKLETEIFDRASLSERLMEDEDLVNEILSDFFKDMKLRFAKLKETLDNDEVTQARHHAHTIKGAAGNIGAPALQKMALAVEIAAHSGDTKKTTALIPLLEEQLEILRAYVQADAPGGR